MPIGVISVYIRISDDLLGGEPVRSTYVQKGTSRQGSASGRIAAAYTGRGDKGPASNLRI